MLASVTAEYLQEQGFGKCFKISNGVVEVIISLDRGPRILRFSLAGQDNLFYNDQNLRPHKLSFDIYGGERHIPCGGHRLLMHSDSPARTYYPDNAPVELLEQADGYLFQGAVEKHTNIQKSLLISLEKDQPFIQVSHKIKNKGVWDIEATPWAFTSLNPGGVAYIPMPRSVRGEAPGCSLHLWDLCDLSQRTINVNRDRIILLSKPEPDKDIKIGLNNEDGYMAYFYKGQLFLKLFDPVPGGFYPYGNCNIICQMERDAITLSSLGEAGFLMPDDEIVYTEKWEVYQYQNQKIGEEDIEKLLRTHLQI